MPKGVSYTPDFVVMLASGEIELHGSRATGGMMRAGQDPESPLVSVSYYRYTRPSEGRWMGLRKYERAAHRRRTCNSIHTKLSEIGV